MCCSDVGWHTNRASWSCTLDSAVQPACTRTWCGVHGCCVWLLRDRLQELDVSHNQLTGLPPQMGLMGPTLRVLLLEGNCIRVIRRPVLEKGTASVLEWLKDRIPA